MKIAYFQRNVYGNNLIYPIGPGSEDISILTHKKTFTLGDMKALQRLGVDFIAVPDPEVELGLR